MYKMATIKFKGSWLLFIAWGISCSITSCRTIQFADIYPSGSIQDKIPTVETRLDATSCKINTRGKYSDVIDSNYTNVLGNDLSHVVKNDFEKNVMQVASISSGVADCRLISLNNSPAGVGWTIFNAATAFVPSLLSVPYYGRKSSLEIEVEIKDKSNKTLKTYKGRGSSKFVVDIYDRYDFNTVDRVVTNNAMMSAIASVKNQIQNDHEMLNEALLGSLTEMEFKQYEKCINDAERLRDSLIRDQELKDSIRLSDANYYYTIGNEQLDSKNYIPAINNYSKSLQFDSQNPNTYNNRGVAYYNLGKYNDAIRDYKKCLKINPADENAQSNIFLAKQRKSERTIAILNATSAVLNATSATLNTINGVPTSTQSNITQNKQNENENTIRELETQKEGLERQLVDVRLEIIKFEKDQDLAVINGNSSSISHYGGMKILALKRKSSIERNIDICNSKINKLKALNP